MTTYHRLHRRHRRLVQVAYVHSFFDIAYLRPLRFLLLLLFFLTVPSRDRLANNAVRSKRARIFILLFVAFLPCQISFDTLFAFIYKTAVERYTNIANDASSVVVVVVQSSQEAQERDCHAHGNATTIVAARKRLIERRMEMNIQYPQLRATCCSLFAYNVATVVGLDIHFGRAAASTVVRSNSCLTLAFLCSMIRV